MTTKYRVLHCLGEYENFKDTREKCDELDKKFPYQKYCIQKINDYEHVFKKSNEVAYQHIMNKKLKDVDCYELFDLTTDYINENDIDVQEILSEYNIELDFEKTRAIMAVVCYDLLARLVNIGVDKKDNSVSERTWVPEE